MKNKLKYEKYNNADNIITIDLHNNYTVIAISGYNKSNHTYTTTLFLKDNLTDRWELIEKAEKLVFKTNVQNINRAILKQISIFLEEGFFDYYIQRYKYTQKCFEVGNEIAEKERLSNTNVS